jgi:chromosome segregation ATPase
MSKPATKADLDVLERRSGVKFQKIDQRFEQVDQRFEQIDKRFEQIDQRFKQIDQRFEQVDQRFEKMDRRFDHMDANFTSLAGSVLNLTHRVDNIEAMMATKSDIQRVLDHIDAFAGQIQNYSRKAAVHDYRFNQIEPKVEDHERRLSLMEKRAPEK